jgi:hypothetical protein
MALSKQQQVTAWVCFAAMAAMLVRPPWLWQASTGWSGDVQVAAGYEWLWTPPEAPLPGDWQPTIWWGRWFDQCTVVAVGMVVLLFVREVQERAVPPRPA